MGPVSGRKVMERSRTSSVQGGIALAVGVLLLGAHPGWAADCSVTSIGFVPINDLGPALYLGQYQGGLYPGGSNSPPPAHFAEGRARALAIRPLDALGNPDPSGRIVLMSVGYSNATQEWCNGPPVNCQSWTFKGRADADSRVNHVTLDIVNGAKGGEPAPNWDEPTDANYDRILTQVLTSQGLTEAQVQIIWLKLTTSGPTISLPNSNAEAFQLVGLLADIVRTFRIRYPNIRMVFVSSRIYAGYAGYPVPMSGAHPEPYAHESGFSGRCRRRSTRWRPGRSTRWRAILIPTPSPRFWRGDPTSGPTASRREATGSSISAPTFSRMACTRRRVRSRRWARCCTSSC